MFRSSVSKTWLRWTQSLSFKRFCSSDTKLPTQVVSFDVNDKGWPDISSDFDEDPAETLIRLGEQHPELDIYKCKYIGCPTLIALNAQIGCDIYGLEKQGNAITMYVPALNKILGELNLLVKQGDQHRYYQSQCMEPMHPKSAGVNGVYQVDSTYGIIANKLNELETHKSEYTDLIGDVRRMCYDVALRHFFGTNTVELVGDEQNQEYMLDLIVLMAIGIGDRVPVKPGTDLWIALKARSEFIERISHICEKAESLYKDGTLDTHCALFKMFDCTKLMVNRENEWSRSDILLHLFLLCVEQTSNAMANLFYCTYKYPDQFELIKSKLSNAYPNLIDPSYMLTSYNEIEENKYLQWYFLEIMRMIAVSPALGRFVINDVEMLAENSNDSEHEQVLYKIPKNSLLVIANSLYHRSSKYWGQNCHEFSFERFETIGQDKMKTMAMMPFGRGNRW